MSNMSWQDERIEEINKDIASGIDQYARECKAQYYIDEYHAIINSNAKTFEEFKQQFNKQFKRG